jgi:hypothetical protein
MATAPLSPQPLSQEPAPLSEAQRLIDVFIAPSKTFSDLRRNAMWWAPFLIIAIASSLYVYVIDQKIGFRKVAENQIQLQPKAVERLEQLPPGQREQVMQRQTTITRYISYGIPVVALLIYLVFAGLLYGTVTFAAGARMKFAPMFALIVYTRLPELVRVALSALSVLAGVSSDSFNIQNPVATNLGYFIDPSGSPVLRALLTPLDIVTIWTLILVAIGIPCISNVKRGTSFAIVFGWFLFVTLLRVGAAAAF